MADLGELGDGAFLEAQGPLSRLAREQYAALVEMRWRMFRNNLRSIHGLFELGANGIAYMIYGAMGLGLGIGLGAGAYSLVSTEKWQYLPVLFWVVFAVWQMLPVALASFQQQFDLSVLLRFPVSFGGFVVLYIVFGLGDVSTILGGLCCLGILIGTTIARSGLFFWTALVLVVYAAFNILLARAVFAWVDRLLAQRRTREIVSALFLLGMLSLQLLNPALREDRHHGATHPGANAGQSKMVSELEPWEKRAEAVLLWLPPGLAASGVKQAGEHAAGPASVSFGGLGAFVLVAGGVLAWRLKAEFRGENLGEAPARKQAQQRETRWLLDGSGPIAAILEKELRTVLRSMPLLFALGGPLLMVVVIGSLFRNGSSVGGHPFSLAFPVSLAYALLGFTQLIYNNLGAEGTGIQVLFLSPTPIRTVLLAKNLFHGLLFCLVAVLAGALASLRMGLPDAAIIAGTAGWILFALPANMAAGDVMSLTMPYRVNLGRMSRQRGSQASALLSMLIQMAVLGVGAAVFGLCSLFGRLWLAAPVFLVLAGGMVFAWMRVLGNVDAIANRNREELIAVLAKTE